MKTKIITNEKSKDSKTAKHEPKSMNRQQQEQQGSENCVLQGIKKGGKKKKQLVHVITGVEMRTVALKETIYTEQ